jgi:hypothetical protein
VTRRARLSAKTTRSVGCNPCCERAPLDGTHCSRRQKACLLVSSRRFNPCGFRRSPQALSRRPQRGGRTRVGIARVAGRCRRPLLGAEALTTPPGAKVRSLTTGSGGRSAEWPIGP